MIFTAIALVIIGALEGVVFLLRYRSANHRSAVYSAFMSLLIATLRLAFIIVGANALINDNVLVAFFSYVPAAVIATGITHEIAERRKARDLSQKVGP